MRRSRVLGACLLAVAVGACSTGDDGAGFDAGGDARYDALPPYDGGGTGDAAHEAGGGDGGGMGDGASQDGPVESGDDAANEAGGDDGGGEAGTDGTGGGDAADAGGDATSDAGDDATADAAPDAAPDSEAGILVPPTCDGVIMQGEYGGAGNQNTSGTQTWYFTWDDKNLYVAIDNANVAEANVVYFAAGAGLTLASGYSYDDTDVTTLPFGATLVVYAKQSYDEARIVVSTDAGAAWGAAQSGAVQVCANASPTVREEVIPWSLVGGRPASFDWVGYLAADPNQNPQGFIYGQEPSDDPGGGPANNETYTKYFAVPDATPGVDGPFADEL